jgi:hypothetical protein
LIWKDMDRLDTEGHRQSCFGKTKTSVIWGYIDILNVEGFLKALFGRTMKALMRKELGQPGRVSLKTIEIFPKLSLWDAHFIQGQTL